MRHQTWGMPNSIPSAGRGDGCPLSLRAQWPPSFLTSSQRSHRGCQQETRIRGHPRCTFGMGELTNSQPCFRQLVLEGTLSPLASFSSSSLPYEEGCGVPDRRAHENFQFVLRSILNSTTLKTGFQQPPPPLPSNR